MDVSRARAPHPPLTVPSFWQRLFPEGAIVFILLLLLTVLPAAGMERSGWDHLVVPVGVVAFLGYLAGWASARVAVLDTMAHLLAVVTGAIVSAAFVARSVEVVEGSLPTRMRHVLIMSRDWYMGVGSGRIYEDVVLSLLLGLIVWMIAYLSAWVLFRRGWLAMALLQPLLLLLVNLGFAPDPPGFMSVGFCAAAIPLAARYHLFRKQQAWARFQQGSSGALALRFLSAGAVVGLVVTLAGWNTPVSVSQELLKPIVGEVGMQVESVRDRAVDFVDERIGESGTSGNAYSDFQDAFSIGGDASTLSSQPEVLVQADEAPYLAAQWYNVYDGRGWSTDLESTFDPEGPDGRRYAPAMSFGAGQQVTLSPIEGGVSTVQAMVTPLVPRNGMLLTVDTFLSANVESSVRLSWMQLNDAQFDVSESSLSDVPPDLMAVSQYLRSLTLTGLDDGFGPLTGDDGVDEQLRATRADLQSRFLDVRWVANAEGAVQWLIVSGQVPIYDDVEAVEPRDDAGSYGVRGVLPAANEDDLRNAGDTYPAWVTARYLDLPDTVTTRTRDYAGAFATGGASTYDIVRAIEADLRESITYDLTVEPPPNDEDVVDYVLFEDARGYCEHYATAMAVLMRSLDIPARVVAGYAPGAWDEAQAGFVYLQQDAHLWVEVYFPGYGWIPFEPTSSESLRSLGATETGGEADEPTLEDVDAVEPTADAATETEPTPTASVSTPSTDVTDAIPPATVDEDDGGRNSGTAIIIATTILAVAAIIVGVWRLWMRQLRGLAPMSALYVRLQRFGRLAGVASRSTTTPREFGDALAAKVPTLRQQTHHIVTAYEIDQFGKTAPSGPVVEAALNAWRRIRGGMAKSLVGRFRWRGRNTG